MIKSKNNQLRGYIPAVLSGIPARQGGKRLNRLLFVGLGLFSMIWFLIRVFPKPSRAGYPCQRVVFPLASGFVLWLISLFTSARILNTIRRGSNLPGRVLAVWLLLAVLSISASILLQPYLPVAADSIPFHPSDPPNTPNTPMGTSQGIFPGRVVWSHDARATSWNGSGRWSEDKYNDQAVIDGMFSDALTTLTGQSSDSEAWKALFHHFNKVRGPGEKDYQSGEKIAIKINLNACKDHGHNSNRFYSSPHMALALLRQLVNKAGVEASDITFFDATRYVPSTIFDKCKAEFPGVVFQDWEGGDGRRQVTRDLTTRIHWSENLTLEPDGGNPTYMPSCVSEAAYFINLGQLKGHNLAGVTLTAKNMFGAIMSYPPNGQPQSSAPKNAGLHPYATVHNDFHFGGHWDFDGRDMGTYNPLVDLLGYAHLGGKTLLGIVDGLYSAPDQSTDLQTDFKFQAAPFNGDWPNSLFLSQDLIALESVCLDFLRSENSQVWVKGNVDNYLHESAMAGNPPSGFSYDPEADGKPLSSLGVHEHWNNADDKQYSRNLGTGNGIELIRTGIDTNVLQNPAKNALPEGFKLINYPNPFNAGTTIEFLPEQSGRGELMITDVQGRIVKQEFVDLFSGIRVQKHLNFSGKPTGVYFARMIVSGKTAAAHRMVYLK